MSVALNLGFPRIGAQRELKRALESFWSGKTPVDHLLSTARELRLRHWQLQRDRGIHSIPSNDFSMYDHVLDTSLMVGAIPERYAPLLASSSQEDLLRTYFAMARGFQNDAVDVPAMEMTKWFDTNYHYIVPEFTKDTQFSLVSTKAIDEFLEAKSAGIMTRPVLLGPVSYLLLGKMQDGASQLTLLDALLPVYTEVITKLHTAGAEWIQLDEPCLVMDLSAEARAVYKRVYDVLRGQAKLFVTTYFGALGDNTSLAASLGADAFHVDLVRAPDQLDAVLQAFPKERIISGGVIDGRNIWRADLDKAYALLRRIADDRGTDHTWAAPSCSLLHSPVDLSFEQKMDPEIKQWLAFATEKLSEVSALANAVQTGSTNTPAFTESRNAVQSRSRSSRIHNPAVSARVNGITPEMRHRKSPFAARRKAQEALGLPILPTTTIGSFPQTPEVRAARAEFKAGKRTATEYDAFLKEETERTIRIQESIGLDVLVHGEFERNDMVEYFGEQLDGFVFTQNGWVQSYGSRCVKPPIIFGDVSRPAPMTVAWSAFAQSLTDRPMKGMLTGPVTILQWSFVRDDQPRSVTCDQIALAIRDEAVDLEAAGLKVIQIDEPAIREGLPLRRADWDAYLDWAVGSFGLSASGVRDETQIHTHMCYSEFNEIIGSVAAMDADVVSMETSRSNMELLDVFAKFNYPNEIGPGVYDIHSPRVPGDDEMITLLKRAVEVIPPRQIWVNPDCGLKTRGWAEVVPALEAMVRSAQTVRALVQQ